MFVAHALADEKLTRNFNWDSSNDLCWRTFLFIWIECFNFPSLNFKSPLYSFFSRWHGCKSSGITSCPVREMALRTFSSRTLSPMSWDTGFTSRDSLRWYWALLTNFVLTGLFIGAEEYCNSLLSTNQTLNPHAKVSNLSSKAFNWKFNNGEGKKRSLLYGDHTEEKRWWLH